MTRDYMVELMQARPAEPIGELPPLPFRNQATRRRPDWLIVLEAVAVLIFLWLVIVGLTFALGGAPLVQP
jgi:hypothetical protein